jgi:hypothetical protein
VKIVCHCGASIVDQTDDLPHKAHLIPDQEWFAVFDAIDIEVIDALASGHLQQPEAYKRAREFILRSSRLMFQCRNCGRLYVDDRRGNLECFRPATEETSREVLRSREGRT